MVKDAREQGDKPNTETSEILNSGKFFFSDSDEFIKLCTILERRAKEFVQRVKYSMTFWLRFSTGHWKWLKMRLKNKIFGVCTGRWSKCRVIHPRHWTNVSFTVAFSITTHFPVVWGRGIMAYPELHLCNRERTFSFTLIIDHHQRYEALFKESFQV